MVSKLKLSLLVLAALVVLGSALVGCSGGEAPAASSTDKQIDATAKPAGKGPHASAGGGANTGNAGAPSAQAQ